MLSKNSHSRPLALLVCSAGLAIGAMAQSGPGTQPTPNSRSTQSTAVQSSGISQQDTYNVGNRGISDRGQQRLVREVRHELVMLPYYSIFDNLAYQVNGNQVVLMGEVHEPSVKRDAENSIKRIEGVDSVQNNIKVLPPSPFDDQLRMQLYRAIYNFDGLSRYAGGAVPPIHIIVDNGHVSLEGVVDNESDKNMANIRASGVPGVFDVKNNLRVVKN